MTTTIHDRRTTLCLACSSSLPPKSADAIYTTNCCKRPICPSCIASNPRLARYDPCLACLAGVNVLTSSSSSGSGLVTSSRTPMSPNTNLSGAVRDEDTFILGDDEDDDDDEENGAQVERHSLPPPYEPESLGPQAVLFTAEETATSRSSPNLDESPPPQLGPENTRMAPYKYYLDRADTLQGLSLRFGVDVGPFSSPFCLTNTCYLRHAKSASSITYPQASSVQLHTSSTHAHFFSYLPQRSHIRRSPSVPQMLRPARIS